jgi:hypothetical protein
MLEKLEIWASDMGMSQKITQHTRRRAVKLQDGTIRMESATLDHLYANGDAIPTLADTDVSDHLAICLELDETEPEAIQKKVWRRDWIHH